MPRCMHQALCVLAASMFVLLGACDARRFSELPEAPRAITPTMQSGDAREAVAPKEALAPAGSLRPAPPSEPAPEREEEELSEEDRARLERLAASCEAGVQSALERIERDEVRACRRAERAKTTRPKDPERAPGEDNDWCKLSSWIPQIALVESCAAGTSSERCEIPDPSEMGWHLCAGATLGDVSGDCGSQLFSMGMSSDKSYQDFEPVWLHNRLTPLHMRAHDSGGLSMRFSYFYKAAGCDLLFHEGAGDLRPASAAERRGRQGVWQRTEWNTSERTKRAAMLDDELEPGHTVMNVYYTLDGVTLELRAPEEGDALPNHWPYRFSDVDAQARVFQTFEACTGARPFPE